MRGRAYTRYQRMRMIRRRAPWAYANKLGKLAKHSYVYRCRCEYCAETRHAHARRKWQRDAWREVESYYYDCWEMWREMLAWFEIETEEYPAHRPRRAGGGEPSRREAERQPLSV